MKNALKHSFHYARFVATRVVEDRCLMVAGSLTYTSLLALVPVFAVTIALTARMPVVASAIHELKLFVLKNLLPDVAGKMVGVYMEQFAQNAAQLTVIGLVIIFMTAVALMFTIDGAFNDIWRTKQARNWWKRIPAYLGLLSLGPLLIGAGLTVTSYVLHWTHRLNGALPMKDDWLIRTIPFALTTLALVLAYRTIPQRFVPLRHAVFGGVFAALLFECVKYLFVAYIVRVPTYDLVYGAFASLPIFLVWLFCCWMVALVGAEVTATLSYFGHADEHSRHPQGAARQAEAMRLRDALADSKGAQGINALRLRAELPIDITEDILHSLVDAGLVAQVSRGRYALVSAGDAISDEILRAALFKH